MVNDIRWQYLILEVPLTNEISNKLQTYANKIRELEDKGDFDGVLQNIVEYKTYLEGLSALETDVLSRTYYFSIAGNLNVLKRVIIHLQESKEKERDSTFKLNELTDDIRRLKERMDRWESHL